MSLKKRLAITIALMVLIPALLLCLFGSIFYTVFVIGEQPPRAPSVENAQIVENAQSPENARGDASNVFDEQAFAAQLRPGGRLFRFALAFGLCALALIVASFTIGVVYLSRKILPPMKELSASAKRISAGDLDFEILGSDVAEMRELCAAFDEMRRRLKAQVAQSLEYERERNLMLAHISHDLRTPVTAIKGYAEGILDGVAATPEMQARYLETICQKSRTMEQMIEQMSDYSELELGRMSFDFERVDIAEFLRELEPDFRADLERADGGFSSALPPDGITVRVDRRKLGRVFQNVLSNSIKYRSPDRALEVRLTAERTPTGVHIVLADNGRGIAQADAERVFEGFYRGDPARTGGTAGHGLGLAISRQIVARHNGRIWITGREGEGVEVHITLPKEEEPSGEDEKGGAI